VPANELDLAKCYIRGQNHYKGNIQALFDANNAGFAQELEIDGILEPEPNNPHDPNAVILRVRGYAVGYIAQENAAGVKAQIGSGVKVNCKLIWNRDPEASMISVVVTSCL
jgi:hypothetical protein